MTLTFLTFASPYLRAQNKHTSTVHVPKTLVTFLVDANFKPYSFEQEGAPAGIIVDIISLVNQQLENYRVVIEAKPWATGKKLLKQGKYFALAGAYFHGHDWPYLYPYSHPLYNESLVTICNNESSIKKGAMWPEDYVTQTIGIVGGYDGWVGASIRSKYADEIQFFEFPNIELMVRGVNKTVVDCAVTELASYKQVLTDTEARKNSAPIHNIQVFEELDRQLAYVGYSEPGIRSGNFPYADDFQKAFDVALFSVIRDGKAKQIFEKYNVPYSL